MSIRLRGWTSWIWAGLLPALLLRLLYLKVYVEENPFFVHPSVDAGIYEAWAQLISEGDWLSRAEGVFYRAPLFPYLVAILIRAFGNSMPAAAILQIVLGLATISIATWIATRIAGPRAGWWTLLALVLYGPLMALESKLLPTTLGLFLHTSSLALVLLSMERQSRWAFLFSGVVLGASILVRPFWLVLAVATPLLFLERPILGWLRRWLPLMCGVALVVAPVTVRNFVIGDDLVLVSSNGGMTFFQGNNPENRSGLLTIVSSLQMFGNAESQRDLERTRAEAIAGRPFSPSETSRFWFGQGVSFAVQDPVAWVMLEARKFYRFVTGFEYADNYSYYAEREYVWPLRITCLPVGVLLCLGFLGLATLPRSNRAAHLARLSAMSGLLGCLMFYVSSRYRMDAVPALAILGGAAASIAIDRGKDWFLRHRVAVAGAVVLLLASFLPAGAPARSQESISYLQLGSAFEREGRLDEALEAYDRAISLFPENAFAWRKSLQLVSMRPGGVAQSLSRFDEAPATVRSNSQVLYVRGVLLQAQGSHAQAMEVYDTILAKEPSYREVYFRKGTLLEEIGRPAEAERAFFRAYELGETNIQNERRLARAQIEIGVFDRARETCTRILARYPGDPWATDNLATALVYLGEFDAAEVALSSLEGVEPTGTRHLARGLLHWRRGEVAAAEEEMLGAWESDPDDPRTLYYYSLAAAKSGHASVTATVDRNSWTSYWTTTYGPGIDLEILQRWIDDRSMATWGQLPREPILQLLDRFGPDEPNGQLRADLRQRLEEEGIALPPGAASQR